MATPESLAAVTAAVRGEDPPAPVVTDPPAAPEAGTETPPGDTPPASQELLGDAAPSAPATPELDEHGRMRGPDGKFVAATPKPGEAATTATGTAPAASAPPAAPATPAVPAKAADPVNDPPPAGARPETRERITTLANLVKEERGKLETASAELETTRADLEMLLAPIKEAGAELEQFQESMELLKLINSPHQHEQMEALQRLQGAAAELAQRLGQVVPGTDPLAGFPDLQQQVQANPQLRKVAEEAAQGRRFAAATQQHQRQTQQRSQQTQAQQQAIQQGQAAVRSVEQTLEATDPQYKAKIAVMRADEAFKAELRKLHPTLWAPKFAERYRTVQVAAPAVVSPASAAAPAPLRAKQPAGTQARPPANSREAVAAAVRAVGAA